MGIRPHRQIPDELPPARLYLDDIQEIAAIFRRGKTYRLTDFIGEEKPLEPSFRVRNFVCDSLADLHTMGGETCDFRLEFENFAAGLVVYRTGCMWWMRGISEEGRQLFYGKLRALFDGRVVVWKQFLNYIPWLFFPLISTGVSILLYLAGKRSVHTRSLWELSPFLGLILLFGLVLYDAYFRHTVVVLKYSHEVKSLGALLQKWAPYVISALIGVLVTKLAEKVLKLVWP